MYNRAVAKATHPRPDNPQSARRRAFPCALRKPDTGRSGRALLVYPRIEPRSAFWRVVGLQQVNRVRWRRKPGIRICEKYALVRIPGDFSATKRHYVFYVKYTLVRILRIFQPGKVPYAFYVKYILIRISGGFSNHDHHHRHGVGPQYE